MALIDATPATVDLKLYQGDDFFLRLAVLDTATGQLADLSGATPKAQIRQTPPDDAILAELDCLVDDDGTILLHLDNTQSLGLVGVLAWDAQLTHDDGTIQTIASGRVRMVMEVTRP